MYGCTLVAPAGVEVMSQLVSRVPIAPLIPVDWGPTVTIVGKEVGAKEGLRVGTAVGGVGMCVGKVVGDVGKVLGVALGSGKPHIN